MNSWFMKEVEKLLDPYFSWSSISASGFHNIIVNRKIYPLEKGDILASMYPIIEEDGGVTLVCVVTKDTELEPSATYEKFQNQGHSIERRPFQTNMRIDIKNFANLFLIKTGEKL